MNERRPRPPSDWDEVFRSEDEPTGLVVRVMQDKASRIPRYNIEIGKWIVKKDGDAFMGRRVPVFLDRDKGTVMLRYNLEDVLQQLMSEAEGWILETAQQLENEFQASREQERFDRHEPRQPVMRKGKTERKRRRRSNRENY